MAKQFEIHYEIMPDGVIKTTTGDLSGVHHQAADELLTEIAELAGGAVTRKKRGPKAHTHTHVHDHLHQGGGHSHDH